MILDHLLEARLAVDVDARRRQLHRAGVGDHLGPAAARGEPRTPSRGTAAFATSSTFLYSVTTGADCPAVTLKKPPTLMWPVDSVVAVSQHGLAHAGREPVQQHQQRGHRRPAPGRGTACAAGVAAGCEARSAGFDGMSLLSSPLHSSRCMACRGVTRMASQAGIEAGERRSRAGRSSSAAIRLAAPRIGYRRGPEKKNVQTSELRRDADLADHRDDERGPSRRPSAPNRPR